MSSDKKLSEYRKNFPEVECLEETPCIKCCKYDKCIEKINKEE